MTRAVLLDLDRTLLDRDRSFSAFASSQYDRFSSSMGMIGKSDYINQLVTLDSKGAVWKDQVYQILVADLGITEISWKDLFADFDTYIAESYVPFPKVHETLSELSKHYLLALITNGKGEFQQRTIDTLEIGHYFEVIAISEIEKARKPDPEIFLRTLKRLRCEPHEAVYVGDHPDSDIRGARAVGMKAVWKRNDFFEDPVSDGAFEHLGELPMMLKRL